MVRLTTIQYAKGGSMSFQHCPVMDGEWKHGDDCIEVIYKKNINNPLYDEGKYLTQLHENKSANSRETTGE